MKTSLLTLVCLSFIGCARFTTIQEDISYDPKTGNPERRIITRVKATTFFEGSSELSKFKASQTDKTQSTTVGALGQEATSTNLVVIVEKAAEGAAHGAAKALLPKP